MSTVFLVRHGATEWNVQRRAQGQADVPLNEKGRLQALEAANHLAMLPIKAVYSSDLQRAFDTGQAIALSHGLEVIADERLREIDQGEWTGLPVAEIQQRWPELWGEARHYNKRPGGEGPGEVRARALAAIKDAVSQHEGSEVVAVSHGGTIRWVCAEACGYDDRRSGLLRGIGNGGIVSIQAEVQDGKLVVWGLERLDGATVDLEDPND